VNMQSSFLGNLVRNDKEYAIVYDSEKVTVEEAYHLGDDDENVAIMFMTKLEFKCHPDAMGAIKKHGL
jgi:hypothetical protein